MRTHARQNENTEPRTGSCSRRASRPSTHHRESVNCQFSTECYIVFARAHNCRHRSGPRQAGRFAGRPWRRQHHDHRRGHRHQKRPRQTDRLADADGHHPPRQTHRGPIAQDQRRRAARGARRSGVRRLGYFRGRLLRGGEDRRRPRAGAARADSARARTDQALAGGVRSALRQAARRPERQEGQEQARPRRAGDRRHPPVQGRRTISIAW